MKNGLYIISADGCIDIVWHKIVRALSPHSVVWQVDCLDCLYETNLRQGLHYTEELLFELKDNSYIFSARMISYPEVSSTNGDTIHTINDYFGSNCESVILCTDGVYFEVFSKSYDLLLNLSKALNDDEIEEIKWWDVNLCGRSEFVV